MEDFLRYRDLLKELKEKPENWYIQNPGTYIECFRHKYSNWYILTNTGKDRHLDRFCRLNTGKYIGVSASSFQIFINKITFLEWRLKRKIKND